MAATTDLVSPIRIPNGIDTANNNPIGRSDKVIRQGKGQNIETGLSNLESSILSWKFNATIIDASNPGATFLSFNNASKDNATIISFNTTSNVDNARFDEFLNGLKAGARIFIQEREVINNSILFRVTGEASILGTRVNVPVIQERDQGVEFTNNAVLNVLFLPNDLDDAELSFDTFDNDYNIALSTQSVASQAEATFTANPNTSGSNHSEVSSTDTTVVRILEEGFYEVVARVIVQNTSNVNDARLSADVRLQRALGAITSTEVTQTVYIRGNAFDTDFGPDTAEVELSFSRTMVANTELQIAIEARTGSVATNAAIVPGTLVVRKIEASGVAPSISDARILQQINALPASNPNFYYERLTEGQGLAAPSATFAIAATGDGTDFDVIPTRTSVGGILANIPFENLFQGQIALTSDVNCSLEIVSRFTHFEGQPGAFTTPRTLRLDLVANQSVTVEFNGFNSEVIVPLGTINLPGGGTLDITEELIAAPFAYRLQFRLIAFQTGTNTRIAANLSGFDFLNHAIIFKQANRVIGPKGERGDAGLSSANPALARRDTLFTTDASDNQSGVSTPQSFSLSLPNDVANLDQYALVEIGTSRLVTGQISYNFVSAQTLVQATSGNRLFFFPTGTGGADYLGSTYSLYLSDSSTLVFQSGANRGFLRRVRGINLAAPTSTYPTRIPEPLQALASQARVFNITHSDYRSNNNDVFLTNTFACLKNAPTVFPNTANAFENEISGSLITVDDPDPVTAIQDVSTPSGNILTGAGINAQSFGLNTQDQNNWRLVIGGWLFYPTLPSSFVPILRVRERGVISPVTYRDVFGMGPNGIIFKARATTGTTQNFSIRHPLYSTEGRLIQSITSSALSHAWRIYEADTYFVQVSGYLNNALQGAQARDYIVTNINVDQGETTLNFSLGPGTQVVKFRFDSSAQLYGGTAHEIIISVDSIIAGLDEIRVDVLASASTISVSSGNTYNDVTISDGHAASARLMRYIASFRSVNGVETGLLECVLTFFGYDSNGIPRVFDENTFDLLYPALDLRWDDILIHGASGIMQNVQGMFLNPDTPLIEFPRHVTLNDWLSHHDDKSGDWVWDNVHEPSGDTEAVFFPEPVNFANLILVSPNGTRFRLGVGNDGTLNTTTVT